MLGYYGVARGLVGGIRAMHEILKQFSRLHNHGRSAVNGKTSCFPAQELDSFFCFGSLVFFWFSSYPWDIFFACAALHWMWYRLQDTLDSTVRVAKAAQPWAVPDEVVCVFYP